MELECTAIVLSARRHGEGGAIVHLFTNRKGRAAGYVHGGASRRQAAIWQAGNLVSCQFSSRTSSQLAQVRGETILETAAYLMDRPLALSMVHAMGVLLDAALPEGEAYPEFHAGTVSTLVSLTRSAQANPVVPYLQWEIELLRATGFGLDLTACAVTGEKINLIYVSPSSGRAVSAEGAGQWRDRLLPLPSFLLPKEGEDSAIKPVSAQDARDGARLTCHFLTQHVFGARHLPLPSPRMTLQHRLEKAADTFLHGAHGPKD